MDKFELGVECCRVSHAAVYLLGAFSNTLPGIEGSVLLGLGHGLVSPGLFIIVGGVLYDRTGTRDIAFYRGLAQMMPVLSIFFFIFILANCGAPLTLNFVGEFMSLYGTFEKLPIMGVLASSSIVLSAAYSVYFFNRVAFGGTFSKFFEENWSDLTKREFFILFILTFFTVLFGINPSFILDGLHFNMSSLIYSLNEAVSSTANSVGLPFNEFAVNSTANSAGLPFNEFTTVTRRGYSTFALNNKSKGKVGISSLPSAQIDPWFLTGFTDAEGNFSVNVVNSSLYALKYRVNLSFNIGLHNKDLELLKLIQAYFGKGGITKLGKESSQFRISSVEDLKVVFDHFDAYPLLTQKKADYILFKQVYEIVSTKGHLSLEGLTKIVAIRASINLGLSESLNQNFQVIPVPRPIISVGEIPSPYWLSGFVCGDGTFRVSESKSSYTKSGFAFRLFFSICQSKRDKSLMESLVNYLSCGSWIENESKSYGELVVSKFSDIETKIIPLFEKYPMYGDKQLDFESFKKVSQIISVKDHLTIEGREKINEIRAGMNTGRYIDN